MAGYIGTKAVNLSTTGADINGNANVDGTLDVTGATTLASAYILGGGIENTAIGSVVPAAGTFTALTSNGIDDNAAATAVTIDASGNVGIGTAAPTRGPLHLNAASGSAEMHMTTTGNGTASTDGLTIFAGGSVGSEGAGVWYRENGPLRFATNSAERMRIDSSGNVLVGTTASSARHGAASGVDMGIEVRPANFGLVMHMPNEALLINIDNTTAFARFYYRGAAVGNIATNGTSTTFGTTSDYRLKENVEPIQGAGDIIKAMKPVTYTYKADGSWMDGFLAHELQELHPRAVIGEKDAVDEEGNPEYQGVDYSKLTPILTAALQEALNKIDALEARLTALEAKP